MNEKSDYCIEMIGICKSFPGVKALDKVNFNLKDGEVHGLIGENGAGKSTLMKILSGVYSMDEGEMKFRGQPVSFKSTLEAQNSGISLVYQEPQIISQLSIEENICLGVIPKNRGFIDKKTMNTVSKQIANKVGLKRNVMEKARNLSMGEKQMVQIAKAIYRTSSVVIMDEPTSSLTEREKEHLFKVIRDLKANGIGIVYISHRIEELFDICDRVTVLKDGRFVKEVNIQDINKKQLVSLMVGRELGLIFPDKDSSIGKEMLRVENLSKKGEFENISFTLKSGEILGFGGLVGAGRTEIMNAIFGISTLDSGNIYINGEKKKINSPKEAIKEGIAYVTEDRRSGMVLLASIMENMSLPSLLHFVKHMFINENERKVSTNLFMKKLNIKAPSISTLVNELSGGNQQKVIFARWLMSNADIYILDEPTRGIDVGAKEEIYKIIESLAKEGKAVIVISSEMPELIGISQRILVMYEGKITGEIDAKKATEKMIIEYATGVV